MFTIDWQVIEDRLSGYIEGLIAQAPLVLVGLVIFFINMVIARLIKAGVTKAVGRATSDPMAMVVYGRLAHVVAIIIGTMIALSVAVPSFNFGTLITSLGVGSIAIGFAFKDIFENFFAGMYILLSKPFRVGDVIRVGNYSGRVVQIGARATTIKLFTRETVIMPSSKLFNQEVTVVTADPIRRISFQIPIPLGADLKRVETIVLDAVMSIEEVLDDPAPLTLVDSISLTNSSLTLWFFADLEANDERILKSKAIRRINDAMKDANLAL